MRASMMKDAPLMSLDQQKLHLRRWKTYKRLLGKALTPCSQTTTSGNWPTGSWRMWINGPQMSSCGLHAGVNQERSVQEWNGICTWKSLYWLWHTDMALWWDVDWQLVMGNPGRSLEMACQWHTLTEHISLGYQWGRPCRPLSSRLTKQSCPNLRGTKRHGQCI